MPPWAPKLFQCLREYDRRKFFDDLIAGVTVGLVALPLAMAFAIDATGLVALEDLADKLHATGRTVMLCGAMEQPARLMHQAEFEQHVGRENICKNIQQALARAAEVFRTTSEYAARPHRRRSDS